MKNFEISPKKDEKELEMESLRISMEKTFDLLKSKGLFLEYKNYQDWLNKKYPQEHSQQ